MITQRKLMITKLKVIFEYKQTNIFVSSILQNRLRKIKKDKLPSQDILIVFMPLIGDTILYLNVLRRLDEYYHSQGKKCTIVTLRQNITIIEQFCNYDEILSFDYYNYIVSKEYRNEFKKKLCQIEYEKIINPYFDNLLNADLISLIGVAEEKIVADRYKIYPGRIFRKSILKHAIRKQAYTRAIRIDDTHMDFMKQSYFMKEIGVPDFQAKISYMEKTDVPSMIPTNEFAIIAPGASRTGKRWEPEKFASIIQLLVHTYNLDVYICGSENEGLVCLEILKNLDTDTRKRVINHMGKTSLLEYLELIRNAQIIISNDSAPVHMAASVGTPCVCIIGGWDYHRLLPYKIEVSDENTKIPIPIYSEIRKCFNCFDHSVGYKNKECKKCIKMRRPYPCISSIGISEVKNAVDHILIE